MQLSLDDTIAALASAPGPGTRGIIRISGPDVPACLDGHFVFQPPQAANSRAATRYTGHFQLACLDEQIDAALMLWPTARSYTGQPMAEIHTIGSPPILEAMLEQLFGDGIRAAGAGEFTLRAFLSGRLDLVQAEAVLGVIDSSDQQQLDQALRQLAGGVSGRLEQTRSELITILGDLEAGLDFVEEDIEFIPADVLIARLDRAIERLEYLGQSARDRMEAGATRSVVLAGLPNAGKSTLLNALADSRVALVSDQAGTTRDYVTTTIEVEGLQIQLVDTAGQEQAASPVSAMAQQLQSEQVQTADLIVWCSAADQNQGDRHADEELFAEAAALGQPIVRIGTKADLYSAERTPRPELLVSATEGNGVAELRAELAKRLRSGSPDGELIGSTGARCHDLLRSAAESLRSARTAAAGGLGDEIVAIEIRSALESIGRILGVVYTDDILDHIFSNFCIGK